MGLLYPSFCPESYGPARSCPPVPHFPPSAPRGLPRGRERLRRRAHGTSQRGERQARGSRRDRHPADRGGAQAQGQRDRCLPASVWPRHRGRRGADVSRRSAAAGARCGDRRRADPRQDRRYRLGRTHGRKLIHLRQRRDLLTDADGRSARTSRGSAEGHGQDAQARGQPTGRTRDPHRDAAGHAHPRRTVRLWPHDQ